MTPRQFCLLIQRHEERIRMTAAMHGIKMEAPAKPKQGMGPEVFHAFAKAFQSA